MANADQARRLPLISRSRRQFSQRRIFSTQRIRSKRALLSLQTKIMTDFKNSLGMEFVKVTNTKVMFCKHQTTGENFARFMEAPNREYKMKEAPSRYIEMGDSDVRRHLWRYGTWRGFPIGRNAPTEINPLNELVEYTKHPVCYMNRLDAEGFCLWLSKAEGRRYRLPTDREWSIAAGIPEEPLGTPQKLKNTIPNKYPWEGGISTQSIIGNYCDISYASQFSVLGKFGRIGRCLGRLLGEQELVFTSIVEGHDDGAPTTSRVGSFRPNGSGLCDMGGNVWEWTSSDAEGPNDQSIRNHMEFAFNEYQDRYTYRDPSMGSTGVLRGGSWSTLNLTSSARRFIEWDQRLMDFGFRIVVE